MGRRIYGLKASEDVPVLVQNVLDVHLKFFVGGSILSLDGFIHLFVPACKSVLPFKKMFHQ